MNLPSQESAHSGPTSLQTGSAKKLTPAERQRTYRQRHPDRVKEAQKAWRDKNKEYDRARKELWRQNNPDYGKQWIEQNAARMQELRKVWRDANTHRLLARDARRRAARKNATPLWANHDQILQLYFDAKTLSEELGVKFEVDHIVPLQGKVVCGLHWEGNLQIIPANDNRAKGNRTWPGKP